MDIFELMDIGENSEIEFKKLKIVFQKTCGKHICNDCCPSTTQHSPGRVWPQPKDLTKMKSLTYLELNL